MCGGGKARDPSGGSWGAGTGGAGLRRAVPRRSAGARARIRLLSPAAAQLQSPPASSRRSPGLGTQGASGARALAGTVSLVPNTPQISRSGVRLCGPYSGVRRRGLRFRESTGVRELLQALGRRRPPAVGGGPRTFPPARAPRSRRNLLPGSPAAGPAGPAGPGWGLRAAGSALSDPARSHRDLRPQGCRGCRRRAARQNRASLFAGLPG